jgi:hypothetical protein
MDLKRFEILDKPGQAEAVAPEFQVGEYQFFANSPTARALLSEEECAHIREVSNLLNRCNRDWGDLSFNPDDARHHAAAQKLMDRRRRLHNILAYLERALERI